MLPINKHVTTALKLLNEAGFQAYLVGGSVRDYLLKEISTDFDITTNALPLEIERVFSDFPHYDFGKKFGTIVVIINKQKIDITPFRKESNYSDYRHPDDVSFANSLIEDISRRDFTINSLCIDYDGNLIDYFSGLDDLNNKIIKTINDPNKRFKEDPLRILRALRFKTRLNFQIEEKTKQAMFANKDLLVHISWERKKQELLALISYDNAYETIKEYLEIFHTFIHFNVPDRTNNFTNPYYSLAYLLRNQKVNFIDMKFLKSETDLLNHLINASNIDIADDYQLITILSNDNASDILSYLEQLHYINLEDKYKKIAQYCINIMQLAINGDDLKAFGYEGIQIKHIKNHILELIHQKKLMNNRQEIINYLKSKKWAYFNKNC